MSISDWKYDEENVKEFSFELPPVGDHRVRIEGAEEAVSKAGMDMIKLTIKVSGHAGSLWHYIVFMPEKAEMTNTNLKSIYDSFGVEGLNLETWKGKVGGARIKHRPYNGEQQANISYFLKKDKQEGLPAWSEEKGTTGDEIPF